jgi:copper chaperone CopZ
MRRFALLAVALVFAPAAALACPGCDMDKAHQTHASAGMAGAPASAIATAPLPEGQARVTIPVSGMHCEHCTMRVKETLSAVPGVKAVDADLDKGQAVVAYEKGKVEPAELVKKIDGLGFKAGKPVQN